MTDRRPNVLLLMGDEHSPMAGSTYGGPARTPHLDRLAEQGATFDAAYCNAPLCVPSRMSMLTGRYAHRVGVHDLASVLDPDVPTIAHALRGAGYDTALAGKQHFVGPDQLHGFRAQLARDAHVDENPLFAWPDDRPGPQWEHPLQAGAGRTDLLDADDEVERAALDYLAARAGEQAPWFLCASFIAPHWPYVVPQEYWDQYPEAEVEVPQPEDPATQHPATGRLRERLGVGGYDEETTRRARRAYRAAITHLDDRLGRILAALDELAMSEDTLVLYVSDHGGMLGEHGLWRKMNFYEEAVRVPFVMRWPGVVRAGARPAPPVSLVDLLPTVLAATGTPAPPDLDGQDLLPVVADPGAARPAVFAEYLGHGVAGPTAMLRRGRWKLVHHHGERPELFDLEADPGELGDLAADPAHQEVLESLLTELLRDWDPDEVDREVRRSQQQRLRERTTSADAPAT